MIFILYMVANVFSYNYKVECAPQTLVNSLFSLVARLIDDQIGKVGKPLLPLIVSYLLIVFLGNVVGLISYGVTFTAYFSTTLLLCAVLFLSLTVNGIMIHGRGFGNLFLPAGTPIMLTPLIIPIEILSYTFRVISLSVRIFANMMAGHILLKVIAGFGMNFINTGGLFVYLGLIPFAVVVILMGLETAVAIIQAYVFVILLTMYFHDSILLH